MNLSHRVVILTGATQGIGRATAILLAESGCRLALAARSVEPLQQLAQALNEQGGQAIAVPTDMADTAQAQALVEQTVAAFGTVDVLINNAGVGVYERVEQLSEQDARWIMDVNYFGPLALMQAVLPTLKANPEGGLIINISSIVGRRAIPTIGAYCATKGALERLADSLRVELRPHNVRVSTVYPGVTDTDFVGNSRGDTAKPSANRSRGVPVAKVAQAIQQTIRTERRDVFISWTDRLALWGCALMPHLADWAIYRLFMRRKGVPEK